MPTEPLIIEVRADGTRTVKRNLDDIGKSAAGTEKAALSLKNVLASVSAGFVLSQAVNSLRAFGKEMSSVKAIVAKNDIEFARLRRTAKELGATTRFSATEAASAMTFLGRAGFDTRQVLQSISGTLDLATAGVIGLAEAADISSNVLQGFRLDASEAGRAVDVLSFTANNSNTNIAQLGEAMKFVAPVAAGLGVSLEEAAAAAGSLSDAGLQSSLAGTGLRRVLSELESPAKKTVDILSSLGISTDQVKISQVGLTSALQTLAKAGLDTGQALEVFGDRGGPAFEVLSAALVNGELPLTQALKNAEGSAKQIAKTMSDNLDNAFVQVNSSLENLIINFGDLGGTSSLTKGVNNTAKSIRFLGNNIEAATDALILLVAIAASRKLAPLADDALSAAAAQAKLNASVISGNAVLLNSIEAETGRAKIAAKKAADSLREVQLNIKVGESEIARAKAVFASIDAEVLLENTRFKAQINDVGRARSSQRFIELSRQRLAATNQLALAEGHLATNSAQLSAAQSAATASNSALSAAIARTGIVARATSVSMNALKASVAFLGGPLGVLIVAATAFSIFRSETETTEQALKRLQQQTLNTREELQKLTKESLDVRLLDVDLAIRDAESLESTLKSKLGNLKKLLQDVSSGNNLRIGPAEASVKGITGDIKRLNLQLQEVGKNLGSLNSEKIDINDILSGNVKDFGKNEPEQITNGPAKIDQDVLSSYNDLKLSLKEQIELSKESSVVDKLRFEIANTDLKTLSEAQKGELIQLGKKIDLKEKLAEQAKTEKEDNEKILKFTNDLEAQNVALKKGFTERKNGLELLALQRDLETQLSEGQQKTLKGLIDQNIELKQRAEILDAVNGPKEEFSQKTGTIKGLLDNEEITQGQASQQLLNLSPNLLEGSQVQLDALRQQEADFYAQIKTLRDNDLIDEQQALALKLKLQNDAKIKQLGIAQGLFSGLGKLAEDGSKAQKALLIAEKATALSSAILSIQTNIAASSKQGFPANIGPIAAAIGQGASILSTIRSTPTRALGGDLNAGQLSRVGESSFNRPELFTGASGKQFFIPPERGRVEPLNQSAQPSQLQQQSQSQSSGENINIVNVMDPSIVEEFLNSPEGTRTLVNIIQSEASSINSALQAS